MTIRPIDRKLFQIFCLSLYDMHSIRPVCVLYELTFMMVQHGTKHNFNLFVTGTCEIVHTINMKLTIFLLIRLSLLCNNNNTNINTHCLPTCYIVSTLLPPYRLYCHFSIKLYSFVFCEKKSIFHFSRFRIENYQYNNYKCFFSTVSF